MSKYNFKLPDVGEGTAEAEIVVWHVKAGDKVVEDQLLMEVMTDKATVELTSPVSGVVVETNGVPGEKAAVGSVVVIFEMEDAIESPSASEAIAPSETESSILTPPVAAAVKSSASLASPAVRRQANELGIDLSLVTGTGPGGRITVEDLQNIDSSSEAHDSDTKSEYISLPIIGLRRQIAERMQLSKQKIPHFCYVEEIDVTDLWNLRETMNSEREARLVKLSLLPFLMRAITLALTEFPAFNATYDETEGVVRQYSAIHIGIATQTAEGLFVPVVRNAEKRDLWQNGAEVARLAEAARNGKAKREELRGSTITITSLGQHGGISISPIINYPEVAIIGPNRIIERPALKNGELVSRKMMNLSGAFDHRIIDGYDAAMFVGKIRAILENPRDHF